MLQAPRRRRFRQIARFALQLLLAVAAGTTALLTFRFMSSNENLVTVPHVQSNVPGIPDADYEFDGDEIVDRVRNDVRDNDVKDEGHYGLDGDKVVDSVRNDVRDKDITDEGHAVVTNEGRPIVDDDDDFSDEDYIELAKDKGYFGLDGRNPAILVLAYNRAEYLRTVLDRINSLPRRSKFTVYVSQDGEDADVANVVELHSSWVTHLRHDRQLWLYPDQSVTNFLARHYHWALDQVFLQSNHSHVIVAEDDLMFSVDALTYFEQTASLLDADPSIWCVSSWNDLGMIAYALDNRALFRTDYFPGLGWMLKRSLWLELGPLFPDDHWDQWMRLDVISKGRSCIAPRVSRNRNIGAEGATVNGGFFDRFLATIKFNEDPVEDFGDLSYLLQHPYEDSLREYVAKAEFFDGDLSTLITSNSSQSLEYYFYPYLLEEYAVKIEQELQTLTMPRTLYRGVTVLQTGPRRFVLLIDKRMSPFCPPEHRIRKHPFLQETPGEEGVNCHATCSARSNGTWGCARDHFQYINQCSVLQKHFPCELGCRGSMQGLDIPNYVSNPIKSELYGYCLTTEEWPACDESHWSTSRLCPCTPV